MVTSPGLNFYSAHTTIPMLKELTVKTLNRHFHIIYFDILIQSLPRIPVKLLRLPAVRCFVFNVVLVKAGRCMVAKSTMK